jgi:hypothetical protein
MMNEDELIAEMVNKAEALGYRKGLKQGLLRAAEICENGVDTPHPTVKEHIMRNFGKSPTLSKAIRAEAEKERK